MSRFIAVVCPHCQTKQAVDAEALCNDKKEIVLSPNPTLSRLKVNCSDSLCAKPFTIEIDCTEYKK